MKRLKLAPGLSLPIDAVTETFGILAIKGVGKTYTEMKMAEEMLANRLPIIAIDSMGIFWGLRAHADGKGKGLPITIMGGDHADVPLVPTAGKVVAELLAKENFACILDVSDFRKHEQRKFVMEFAEEFYHQKKKYRDPVHLFMDEGDMWAPQRVEKGYERLLGAIDDIVRRGRQRGIGCTMATQRAAVINKSVLSQVSILIAMQMSGAQDIDAVDYWISKAATKEGRAKFITTIPTLQKGEAFIWSPAWLKIFKKVTISERWTFDSSRTPKVGERVREPKQMAEVDIKKISAAIAATTEKVANESPRLLKAEVVKLRMDLRSAILRAQTAESDLHEARKKKPVAAAPAPANHDACQKEIQRIKKQKVKVIEVPVITPKEVLRIENVVKNLKRYSSVVESNAGNIRGHADLLHDRIQQIDRTLKTNRALAETVKKAAEMPAPVAQPDPATPTIDKIPAGSFKVTKRNPHVGLLTKMPADLQDRVKLLRLGEKKMLEVMIQHFPSKVSKAIIGMLAGYPFTGHTFSTYMGGLKRRGFAEYDEAQDGDAWATEDGSKALPVVEMPSTTEGLVEMWKERGLRAGERKILDKAVAAYPSAVPKAELEAELEMRPHTLSTYIGTLKRLCLAVDGGDAIRASDALFPNGSP